MGSSWLTPCLPLCLLDAAVRITQLLVSRPMGPPPLSSPHFRLPDQNLLHAQGSPSCYCPPDTTTPPPPNRTDSSCLECHTLLALCPLVSNFPSCLLTRSIALGGLCKRNQWCPAKQPTNPRVSACTHFHIMSTHIVGN